MNFLIENWQLIAIGIFVIASLIMAGILIYQYGFEKVRPWAYNAILAAENMYEHGDNEMKFAYYFDRVYQMLPAFIRFFVSKESLTKTLQGWYDQVKDLLDNGVLDNSIQEDDLK